MLPLTLIGVCWGLGEAVAAVTDDALPGPVAGLLVLAAVLVLRPGLQDVVDPVADAVVRLIPVFLVPAVVAVGAVTGDVHVAAAALALVLSVPLGFLVTARLIR